VHYRYLFRLTPVEKANTFDIYEVQFFQIQNCRRFAKLDFGLNLIHVLRPKVSTQPNPRSEPFYPERHGFPAPSTSMGMQGKARSQLIEKVGLRTVGDARF
jgi:hypothetical protein